MVDNNLLNEMNDWPEAHTWKKKKWRGSEGALWNMYDIHKLFQTFNLVTVQLTEVSWDLVSPVVFGSSYKLYFLYGISHC